MDSEPPGPLRSLADLTAVSHPGLPIGLVEARGQPVGLAHVARGVLLGQVMAADTHFLEPPPPLASPLHLEAQPPTPIVPRTTPMSNNYQVEEATKAAPWVLSKPL